MKAQAQHATASKVRRLFPGVPLDRDSADLLEPVRLERLSFAAGECEHLAAPDHRVMIHASPPARAVCHGMSFIYTRGDTDFLPAGVSVHGGYNAPSSVLSVSIAPSLFAIAARDSGLDPAGSELMLRHQFRDPQLEHIVWALDAEHKAGHPHGRLYLDSLGLALAVHLLRAPNVAAVPNTPKRKIAPGLSSAQLTLITDYIESYLDRDLSLFKLASVIGVSTTRLKRSFRAVTGMSVHEYVIYQRVKRAEGLLRSGDLPASQVALDAGFSHQSHMARCMRRVLGVTPRELTRGGK